MKVVCCKNCGAKYQLDDDDDITTFECSSKFLLYGLIQI